ncbi:MAG TPA: choice-of-anchor tandem repeat GloVer-containing protein, partial [Terriglobales bacterium]
LSFSTVVSSFMLLALLTGSAAASEKVLYRFQGQADGNGPTAGLVKDSAGNLYGTTSSGGLGQCFGFGCGTAFQLVPQQDGTYVKNILHTFAANQSDGGYPVGTLAIDGAGNLYGVTEQGGTGPCDTILGGGCGVVYRLSPGPSNTFTYTILYNFATGFASDDGTYPNAGVVLDSAGNLYGTTEFGGDFFCDCGIVYQLQPTQQGPWTEKILYTFIGISQGGSDVSFPHSGVVLDRNGNLFGSTTGGGDKNCNLGCGGVYELIPNGDGTYQEVVLDVFHGGRDGEQPEGGVIVDAGGNIFGTTEFGGGGTGCNNGGFGCGTVFAMRKMPTGYKKQILFRFDGAGQGYAPSAELTIGSKHNLFGTVQAGGANSLGLVFRLTPAAGAWKETILYDFPGGQDGAGPLSGLLSDGKGGFFGTTNDGGGAPDAGTVFQLAP